ncbi:TolC family outer membrane protein [Citreimonas salinaria]
MPVLTAMRKTLTGGLVALATVSGGMAAQAETLAQALTRAYETSGLIEQNRAVLRAADEDVAQAVAALRPVLSWSADVQRQFGVRGTTSPLTGRLSETGFVDNTASAALVASITLYDGGANRLRIDLAKEAVLGTRAELIAVEQQVLLRAVEAFMEVRRALELVALRENNVRVIGQELQAARDRFEVGEVTRTDVALAEARLAAAQSALSAAQGTLAIAVEEYRVAVGVLPENLQQPAGLPRLPASEADAKAIAVRSHPEIAAAQRRVTIAEIGVAIAESARKPSVSLSGRYGLTETFGEDTYSRGGSITLGAEGPIYQGGRLNSLERQALAERDQARAALLLTVEQVQQAVGNAYARLRVARASIDAFEAQVSAATVAFRGVREEATLGARTTLDVLDAEQELLLARSDLLSAQVDETVAAYAILSSTGQLTAEALALPVPAFDPAAYYRLVKDAPSSLSPQGRALDRLLRSMGKQ